MDVPSQSCMSVACAQPTLACRAQMLHFLHFPLSLAKTAHLLSRKSMCQVMIYKSQRVDCEQYLFSSKIPGEERKTSKRTTVTVSVTCEQRYRLFCILPTDFRGKRDCQTLETAHSLVRTVVKYAHDKFLKFRRGSRLECWNFSS